MIRCRTAILGLILSAATAWSAHINLAQESLFELKSSSNRYEHLVASIRPGDVVHLKDGTSFTIQEKLGEGSLSTIFAIRERPHQILRLAKSSKSVRALAETLQGYQELKESGLRLVEIDPQSNDRYILAEKISSDYLTVAEMVLGREFGRDKFFYEEYDFRSSERQAEISRKVSHLPKMNSELQAEMLASFWFFLKTIAPFHEIADLRESNVVYDRQEGEWIIVDWESGSYRLKESYEVMSSVNNTLESLFTFIEVALESGLQVQKEAEAKFISIQEKARALLVKEKIRFIQNSKMAAKFELRCKSLLPEGKLVK